MTGAAAAYVSGLFFVSFFTDIRKLLLFAAAIMVTLLICRLRGLKRADIAYLSVFFAVAVVAGAAYHTFCYQRVTSYIGETVSYSGEVKERRDYDGYKSSYILDGKINGTQHAKMTYFGETLKAVRGDTISFESCVPTAPDSDYLFDSKAYYKSEGIFLSAEKVTGISVTENHSDVIKNLLIEYREMMKSKFRITLGSDCGSFLAGMVFGDRRNIDDSIKTAVYRCGIGHVLAVSGLHISIIAFAFMTLFSYLHVNRFVSFGAVNLLMLALVIMAETPLSAVRALIMTNFLMTAQLFRRQTDGMTSLSGAVLLICLFQPFAIFSAGFQMSVAGTFGIGVAAPYFVKDMPSDSQLQRFTRMTVTMLVTTLMVFPLSILYYDETSLISPIMNVLIVPLCSVSMLIGIVFILTGGLIPILEIAGLLIHIVLFISDRTSQLRGTYIASGERTVAILAFAGAAMVAAIHAIYMNRRLTAAAATIACTVIFVSSAISGYIRRNTLTVAVLGRGANAAIVVTYDGYADIIDLSGHYKTPRYVRKYLMSTGCCNVSSLVLTENAPSQYTAYLDALDFTDVNNICMSGSDEVMDEVKCYGDNGYDMDIGVCKVSCRDDIFTVDYNGDRYNFMKSGTESVDGICVYYGRKKDAPSESNSIYLSKENNNFEIIPKGNGKYSIRRL